MPSVLIIGGHSMKVSDPHRFWRIGDALQAKGYSVRLRECLETGTAGNTVNINDILAADAWIDYSHGTASRKKLISDLGYFPAGKEIDLWVAVAPVPEVLYGQVYGGLWHAEPYIDIAVCFQVNAVPMSCPIAGGVSINFASPLNIPPSASRINVFCDNILRGEPVPHVAVKDNEQVCAQIERLFPVVGAT